MIGWFRKKKVDSWVIERRNLVARIDLLESRIKEAEAWSSRLELRLQQVDARLEEISFYKKELETREEAEEYQAARLLAMNPGVSF